MKMYMHFLEFLNTENAQEVEIIPHVAIYSHNQYQCYWLFSGGWGGRSVLKFILTTTV